MAEWRHQPLRGLQTGNSVTDRFLDPQFLKLVYAFFFLTNVVLLASENGKNDGDTKSVARGLQRPEVVLPFDCPTQTSYKWSTVILCVCDSLEVISSSCSCWDCPYEINWEEVRGLCHINYKVVNFNPQRRHPLVPLHQTLSSEPSCVQTGQPVGPVREGKE
jgi:hypothetical protein